MEVCRSIAVIRGRCQVIYGNAAANVALLWIMEFIDFFCRYVLTSLVQLRLVCRTNGVATIDSNSCVFLGARAVSTNQITSSDVRCKEKLA